MTRLKNDLSLVWEWICKFAKKRRNFELFETCLLTTLYHRLRPRWNFLFEFGFSSAGTDSNVERKEKISARHVRVNLPLAGLGILAISIIAASNPNYSDRSFRGTRIRSTDLSFGSIGIPIRRPPSFERKIGSRTVRVTLLVIQKINKAEEKEKRRRVITEEKNINILYM